MNKPKYKTMIFNFIFFVNILSLNRLTLAAETKRNIVQIKVIGLKSGLGQVGLTLFDEKKASSFPTQPKDAMLEKFYPLNNQKELTIELTDLPEGVYSAFVYHDEDSDKQLKSNFMHIPTEGYGVSEGAYGTFGPPKFKDAKFSIQYKGENPFTYSIKMKY